MIFFRYSIVTFEDLNDKTTIPAFTDNIKNVQFDLRKIKIDEMPQLNNKYMLTGLITIPRHNVLTCPTSTCVDYHRR